MKKLLLSFLTVILSTVLMQAQEVTYDFVNETYGLTRLSGNTSEYVADGTALTENGGIIATLKNNLSDATNASGVRLWADGLRFYKGGTITIAAPEGKHIAKITMTGAKGTGTVANIGTSADASSNLTDGTWTGEANSVCFYYTATSKNQAIGTMTVTLADGEVEGGEEPGTGGDGGDGGDDTELPTVASLTDFIAAAPSTNTKITGTVTVYYQSPDKRYTFITDGTSNLQVYGSLTNAYNNGDQLTGIVGTMSAYGGMSQMVPDVASFGTATAGTPVEPKTVTLAEEIAPCDYVTLTGVNITEVSGKNATITDGTNSIAAYDRFAITLTATENATIVAIGAVYNSNKQLYIVSVNDGEQGGGEDPVDPNAKGQENNPYTVEEAIALGNPGTTAQWVTGMIVGVMNYVEGTGNVFSATELTTNSNIVIASTTEDFGTNIVAVQLPQGKIREDLNLVDRPGNLGKEVSVCGDLIKYCGVTGVKNTTNYTIVGGLAPLPVGETESLTTFVEEQFSVNTKITGTVTVYYQSPDKKYTFITDGTTNLEVYAGGGLPYAYVNGDQLTGIIGKFSYYQNMPQFTPQADSFGEPTPGTAVQPVETTLATVQPADFVMIKNATITSVTADNKTTITVSDASGSRILFDRFAIGVTDATNVNILGIGAVFGEDAQLFPIEITPVTDGINEITTETNGKAAIYDLQGRKLNAPVRGINIINGRKVLVK